MSRRLASLTLDNLDDLPRRCRRCVFWELDPMARDVAEEAGDVALEKEAWVSATLLEWGSCGKLLYVDSTPAGYLLYAPPVYVPRSVAFPTSPVSGDAVLLMTGRVVTEFQGGGLGRMLLQAAAKDLTRRGVRAIEAFGSLVPPGEMPTDGAGEAQRIAAARVVCRAGRFPAGGGLQDGASPLSLSAVAPRPQERPVLARGRRGRPRASARFDEPGAGVPPV